ncbi:MAG: nicotinate phosphoribosyltransferase [Bacteroidales bacterium]
MIIRAFTDNDLYKYTTMNAIQQLFPTANVQYKFINRANTIFPEGFADQLRKEVDSMADLYLTQEEESFIRKRCYFFTPLFIDLLKGYRYNPEEVKIVQNGGQLDVTIEGLWYRTVLWEVPLMSIISELYYKMSGLKPDNLWQQRTIDKANYLVDIDARFSDFGTRRRFSFDIHDSVLGLLKEHAGKHMIGTSNVYLGMKHDTLIIGTHPHEWFMYHGAHYGYRMANRMALENWTKVYNGALGIALCDTFTSDNFFRFFDRMYAKLFDGLRWDSGDPIEFTQKALDRYKELGIDARTKTIIYSDALNVERVQKIKAFTQGKIMDAYGIGTNLTNDVGVTPLNMVIKLMTVQPEYFDKHVPVVKLSDSTGKYSGDPEEIDLCLRTIR